MQHTQPTYPFQMVSTDLFHVAVRTYVVYADRFSAWTEVASTNMNSNANTLCDILRRYFINSGVPEELSSDGGPPFQSNEFSSFLQTRNVSHCISSAYYAQSNGRAEAAVKHMKRILTTNISQSGSLDVDTVAKALLPQRNTPSYDIGASPAELLFRRPISGHLLNPTCFRHEWTDLADQRETAMRTKRIIQMKRILLRKDLKQLKIRATV